MILKEYRQTLDMVSYSEIKCFSLCPRLYFERYVTRTNEQEDKDYFTYGQLVDTLLTQPWDLEAKFVRVARKSEGGWINLVEELQKIELKIADLEPQAAGNKTKAKSLEKARRDLEAIQGEIAVAKSIGDRTQITAAMWDNAHETAEVMKRNPLYVAKVQPIIETSRGSFQQVVYDLETHSKGTLDIMYLSPGLQSILDRFRSGELTKEDAQKEASEVTDKRGYIIDAKTTFSISKLKPAMYATQLGYYQYITNEILGVMLPCYALVGDKDSSSKVAQDYAYAQEVLDSQLKKLLSVKEVLLKSLDLYKETKEERWFPSAKEIRGAKQDCFSCTACKERPYSTNAPYHVTMRDVGEYEAMRK